MIKYLANILTVSRIVFSLILIECTTFSVLFWVLYSWCGLSDILDGAIARKTESATERGAKLDSVADLIFVIVCCIKFLPEFSIPVWLWIWIALIALIKICNYFIGYIQCHRLMMPHTMANKTTGLLLFLLPIAIQFVPLSSPAIIVCTVASFAAIQECYINIDKNVVDEKV